MNAIDIELLSITDLKKVITLNEYLLPYINENDKEPSWDGTIIIFNEKGKQKKNLEGRVSVQVKGKASENLSEQTIKYAVEIVDLKNYLSDGGVIYFVIYINKLGESRIYYAPLEPLKIRTYLSGTKKSQNTKTIQLKSLPKDQSKILGIVSNFQMNSKKQASFSHIKPLTISDLRNIYPDENYELTISGKGLENVREIAEFNELNNIYIYAKVPGYAIPIPIDGEMEEIFLLEKDNLVFSVDNKIYYKEATREYRKDGIVLYLGSNISLIISDEKKTFNIDFKGTDKVRELTRSLEFLIKLIRNKGFYINEFWLDLEKANFDFTTFDMNTEEKRLQYFKDIVRLLDYLGIAEDLDLSELTNQERRDLDILKVALLKGKNVGSLKENIPSIAMLVIGKLKLALIFNQIKDTKGVYQIEDHFQNDLIVTAIDEEGIRRKASIYSLLSVDVLAYADNVRFDVFLPSYKELELSTSIIDDANIFMLKLIEAFDLLKKSNIERAGKLINTALDFAKWIIESDLETGFIDEITQKLNLYQIKKRLGTIEKNEQIELLSIAENSDLPNEIRFGAYVLVDNKLGAELQYNSMDKEQQDFVKKYPIYHFF
ncbi:DUF4365 domain-containing protein [Enterococcus quebecensis]|uniref:Uncharacterized protein n=1 Tax=Enterococcus quebecensis TaxID=903983 RepID=A0A1E5GUI8_9ENTE|nr:DUF4365 domain-containing protein [Enterococcus quebecensis]OEG16353.1 hypothetical protein BCR23_05545 [Enterococcus quebecensis]OJG72776.1 hypothetical protein RV12_GL000874 [Enterococcus quebecensis]